MPASFRAEHVAFLRAPLWPAGHLPHTGGDWPSSQPSPIADVAGMAPTTKLLISPLVGEMAGRPEGGNVGCRPLPLSHLPSTWQPR